MFLAGESINEGLQSAARLKDKQYDVTYHIMAEDLTDVRLVQANVHSNIALIMRAQERGLLGNLAIKLSALGGSLPLSGAEKQSGASFFNEREAKRYLSWLLHGLSTVPDIEIEVDAEEFHTLSGAFRIVDELGKKYPGRLRMAVQMHVPDFLERSKQHSYAQRKIRIVRGAGVYNDVTMSASASQSKTDNLAFRLFTQSIMMGQVPFLGTLTNVTLFDRILSFLSERKLGARFLVLESLYGTIGRKLRRHALGSGVRVVVYTPIVVEWCLDAWVPYCKRRIPMMRKYFWKIFIARITQIWR